MTYLANEYDSRVCISSKDLIAQRSFAKGFSAYPSAAINNQFVGRHYSKQRGRGLNFEELSHYRIGDDTRSMDWKVSNRTGKPHVRVFTEERERPLMLACDQRQSLFFGSERKMKSVIAAEAMALLAWRHIALGDAVASLLFNDLDEYDSRPHRSSELLLKDFEHLSLLNNKLLNTVHNDRVPPAAESLQRTLARLNTLCAHDYLIVLISDFYGFNDSCSLLIKSLSLRNDLLLLQLTDPVEEQLPYNKSFVVSNGQQQLAVNSNDKKLSEEFNAESKKKHETISKLCRTLALSHVKLNTVSATHEQLRAGLPEQASKATSQPPSKHNA